ncbi:MAG TPA: helix-turn-helix transcriptional regulator [Chitinophagaceae bacterium]|jgi:DNA-binding CsgD family transcriptional regulator|nr:helix-turn-helix transcriptional regulator [Chitinophagaceae bacterium]
MLSTKLTSYHELMACVGRNYNYHCPDAIAFIERLGFNGMAAHVQAPVFYIVDYRQSKYLSIDASSGYIYECCFERNIKEGAIFHPALWHKNDLKVFNEKIVPEAMRFLQNQPLGDYPYFSFSFNYRTTANDKKWLTMLQKTTYLTASNNEIPIAAISFILDISHYKEDSRMIYTIEKIDRDFNVLPNKPLFKAVYYPDEEINVLSKREVEVLKLIYEGLSSKKIADKLYISINTVNNHRKNMLGKTNAGNTSELLHYALINGLL